jgi:hypothetical protein
VTEERERKRDSERVLTTEEEIWSFAEDWWGIGKIFWSMPKLCEACHASSAVVYCRADAAYLCVNCDGKVHGANKLASRHERVWMCEVCELAPAIVTCKADAAALCFSCDSDIHSVNARARRHERVPVVPFFQSSCPRLSVVPAKAAAVHINASSGVVAVPPPVTSGCCDLIKEDDTSVVEPASWPFPDLKRPEEAFTKGNTLAAHFFFLLSNCTMSPSSGREIQSGLCGHRNRRTRANCFRHDVRRVPVPDLLQVDGEL